MENEYIVISRQDRTSSTGGSFINLKIANLKGNETICVWDVPKDQGPKTGQLVVFKKIDDFNGKKSAKISDLGKGTGIAPTEQHPLYSLIPHPTKKEVWDETIKKLLSFCRDEKLIGIIKKYSEILYPKYCKRPAATTVHHAYPGGLTTHTWQMLHMLEGLYPCYPYPDDIKIERCIIAILFHDWGKQFEYDECGVCQEQMYLLGHVYMAANQLNNILREEGVEKRETNFIVHCVLAHHGELEYGSPVMPCIPEAQLIHYLDNISAKADMFDTTGNMEKNFALGTHVVK